MLYKADNLNTPRKTRIRLLRKRAERAAESARQHVRSAKWCMELSQRDLDTAWRLEHEADETKQQP
jgi:hypothetical protein